MQDKDYVNDMVFPVEVRNDWHNLALEHGKSYQDCKGDLQKYIKGLTNQDNKQVKLHNNFIYVFDSCNVLVTAYAVPSNKRSLLKQKEKDNIQQEQKEDYKLYG